MLLLHIISVRIVLVLLGLTLCCHYHDAGVESADSDKILLKANALGYTKRNKHVSYSANFKEEKKTKGVCINGSPPNSKIAPNAQTTTDDKTCQSLGECHIGFTKKGDWVAYDFYFDDNDLEQYADSSGKLPIEVVIRVSANKDRKIDMKIYTDYNSLVISKSVAVSPKGFDNFNDISWENISLDPDEKSLRLYIFFIAGNTNMCSIEIRVKKDEDGGGHIEDDDDYDDRTIPFAVNALEYEGAKELDDKVFGSCVIGQPSIDEPDAQTTKSDSACLKLGPCNIGFTKEDESVTYKFKTTGLGGKTYVDIKVRVSSNKPKYFIMELLSGRKVEGIEYFQTRGGGYDEYYDVIWSRVSIDTSYDDYTLVVSFTEGNMNMCSVSIDWSDKYPDNRPTPAPYNKPLTRYPTKDPTPHQLPTPAPFHNTPKISPPITWSAFEYDYSYETSPGSYHGNCHDSDRDDGVNGKYTEDKICNERDDSVCFIGWTQPKDWLMYKFKIEIAGLYNFRVRVAANSDDRKIKLLLTPDMRGPFGKVIDIPDNGWRDFNDVIWKNVYLEKDHYELQVYFVTGYVNLCSTAVYLSNDNNPSTPSPHHQLATRLPSRYPTQYPTPKPPTKRPTTRPTSPPTRSPHHQHCYDDDDYHFDEDNWKDCSWVAHNNYCNKIDDGGILVENFVEKAVIGAKTQVDQRAIRQGGQLVNPLENQHVTHHGSQPLLLLLIIIRSYALMTNIIIGTINGKIAIGLKSIICVAGTTTDGI
eukprot:CAMPEP_0170897126 /NCGR_PEP_ID=MMETSP0734-20130129/45238_1 /TAXON_ID=186038 /ORGANISM="Fragilariopsis kerguelensis, Strain L26-C5" /LENGTH=754 /DNA_ID=CAMNT_0011289567 /DNA_START=50 /DNA_END=2315 /DNA_ORIENTATION=+